MLGIVGLGDIGRELARVARSLGMQVCSADPYVASQPLADKLELGQLLERSDYVSVHAKWTVETGSKSSPAQAGENLFGEAEFRRMKPTAYFINTARGALVDEKALERALREGWIAGAVLDVFKNEPTIVGNPLLQLQNVIGTPHIAGFGLEYRMAQAMRTVDIVRELQAGRIPANAVNASVVRSPRRFAPRPV